MLENRPPYLPRENFIGQPLKVELYEKKLEAAVGGRSKNTGGASARRLATPRLERLSRHYCARLASFDLERR
jgi:hypothetical protein